MRQHGDPGWGYLRGLLVGALVTAVLMLSFPVVAAVGDRGQANSADGVTSLSGASAANLRVTNSQAGAPALDLRVVSGAAPLRVNSKTMVANLNADLLDGKHASAFSPRAHAHTGVYLPVGGVAADASLLDGQDSTAFSPAAHAHTGVYLPVGGVAADASLLDGLDSTAFAPAAHSHDASAVSSGTLATGRYSAYGDLGSEENVNNDAAGDLPNHARRMAGMSMRVWRVRPGRVLVGYGRSGPLCSSSVGSVALDTAGDCRPLHVAGVGRLRVPGDQLLRRHQRGPEVAAVRECNLQRRQHRPHCGHRWDFRPLTRRWFWTAPGSR